MIKKSELIELIKECYNEVLEEAPNLKKEAQGLAEDVFFEVYEIGKSNGYPVQEHGFMEMVYKELVKLTNKKLKQDKISRGGF